MKYLLTLYCGHRIGAGIATFNREPAGQAWCQECRRYCMVLRAEADREAVGK